MFDIATPEDFYGMLVEDFDEYMNEPHSARRAMHCAITAYHLHEWVWGGWLKFDHNAWKALGIRDKDSFLQWIDKACPWFVTIQGLANGTKHFISNPGFETSRVAAPPFMLGVLGAGLDEGAFDGPIPYDESNYQSGLPGYLLIDYGAGAEEHRWLPAAHLLEVVVRFWRDFFRLYRPNSKLPQAKYHLDLEAPLSK